MLSCAHIVSAAPPKRLFQCLSCLMLPRQAFFCIERSRTTLLVIGL